MLKLTLAPWKKSYDKPRECIKKQRHYFADTDPFSQNYGFSSSHVQMQELHHKKKLSSEELMLLNSWDKILESPLDYKEIKPVNHKGN